MKKQMGKILMKINFILMIAVTLLIVVKSNAQEVEYCKNATTGEIITVQARMPCPYPTYKIR